ncbi:Rieske 2Fe-2S domain-containing protein [Deinococcus sp. QL22]|uniref:Rieske 2Fe-2S domain-containing protein n=1 Tax=Deinococcus sp. QL22 TaxID=2939437 RepID=UPI0020175944|nr:Rieske 2Fe-2S domain-containing protein [Deinococcus sp. QL22]UQN08115.1 Rieske 2Fe-2S domain-containing protein [Deinococcus sp. QL22]
MRVLVGPTAEFLHGSQTAVEVDGKSVVVVNYEGQFYALRNNCTHQDYPLLGGAVNLGRIKCERHGSQFELTTGKAKGLPAVKSVAVYQTTVDAGVLYVLPL